jgi:hypothetical protein
VLASNGVKAAMEELRPLCEREIGRPVALDFSSTAALRKRIESGEAFDVTIITVDAIEALTKAGKVAAGTSVPVGRSELGLGIRTGTSRPDIRTRDGLKAALRNAASITYPQDGAARDPSADVRASRHRGRIKPPSSWRQGLLPYRGGCGANGHGPDAVQRILPIRGVGSWRPAG